MEEGVRVHLQTGPAGRSDRRMLRGPSWLVVALATVGAALAWFLVRGLRTAGGP